MVLPPRLSSYPTDLPVMVIRAIPWYNLRTSRGSCSTTATTIKPWHRRCVRGSMYPSSRDCEPVSSASLSRRGKAILSSRLEQAVSRAPSDGAYSCSSVFLPFHVHVVRAPGDETHREPFCSIKEGPTYGRFKNVSFVSDGHLARAYPRQPLFRRSQSGRPAPASGGAGLLPG